MTRGPGLPPKGSVALITPSYAQDFERCRLLCDSIDHFVQPRGQHFILVDNDDFDQFRVLQSSSRTVVNERDLLPQWLRDFKPPLGANARKLWVSTKTMPMRGWHVQQLRRIAIAAHCDADALLYCDSDMAFVRPFSLADLWQGGDLRLYRNPFGVSGELARPGADHRKWTLQAARLNGLSTPGFPAHDYINNLVSWRRQHVLDMCAAIEERTGKHWVAAIASSRTFSECQVYGAYAEGVRSMEGHWAASFGLCRTYWQGDALDASALLAFLRDMDEREVAIGVQSFTHTDPNILRNAIGL
ncbi:MAG: DUF6492 family protein [Ahrensia sp.]|nr:DUF6492 family protein [Ahrensia sp.]